MITRRTRIQLLIFVAITLVVWVALYAGYVFTPRAAFAETALAEGLARLSAAATDECSTWRPRNR